MRCATIGYAAFACWCMIQTTSRTAAIDPVINGEVDYVGLDALPWGSVVHIYVTEVRQPSRRQAAPVAEKNITTEGEQIPIHFSLTIEAGRIRATSTYAVCADITILEREAFKCDKPFMFKGRERRPHVRLTLRRAR